MMEYKTLFLNNNKIKYNSNSSTGIPLKYYIKYYNKLKYLTYFSLSEFRFYLKYDTCTLLYVTIIYTSIQFST